MLPELRQMLEENFLQDEAERWYNPNPDRKADLEALRQRTLLREYKEYLKGKGRLKFSAARQSELVSAWIGKSAITPTSCRSPSVYRKVCYKKIQGY